MADFKEAYGFGADNKEVVIQNKGGGAFSKFLRVDPNDQKEADPSGGRGKWARFIVEKQGNDQVKIKSKETGRYLRIKPNADAGADDKIDINGGGGKWTIFKVHKQGQPGAVKLESAEQAGRYVAVNKGNKIKVGTGGPWTELRFFKEKTAPFTKPYMFRQTNIVVLQHRGGAGKGSGPTKFLRVKPGSLEEADPDGGKGAFAQFEADPANNGDQCRFKSTKTGKYLRIMDNGKEINVGGGGGRFTIFNVLKQDDGSVKLQSAEFGNAYIAVGGGNKVRPGNGGAFTKLMIYRQN